MNDDNTTKNTFVAKNDDDDQIETYSSQAAQDHDLDKGQSPFLGADDPVIPEDVSFARRGLDVDELSTDSRLNATVNPDDEEVSDGSTLQEIGEDVTSIDGVPSNSSNPADDDGGDDTTGRIDSTQKW